MWREAKSSRVQGKFVDALGSIVFAASISRREIDYLGHGRWINNACSSADFLVAYSQDPRSIGTVDNTNLSRVEF